MRAGGGSGVGHDSGDGTDNDILCCLGIIASKSCRVVLGCKTAGLKKFRSQPFRPTLCEVYSTQHFEARRKHSPAQELAVLSHLGSHLLIRVPLFPLFGFGKGAQRENEQQGTAGEPYYTKVLNP